MEITDEGRKAAQLCRARNHSDQTLQTLARLETNIRFFFLCHIFMYFRTLHVVQQEKQSWLNSDPETLIISAERAAMIQEEKAAKMRKEAFDYAFRKFQLGAKSRKCKADVDALKKVRSLNSLLCIEIVV